MKRTLAALVVATAAFAGLGFAWAQDAADPPNSLGGEATSTGDADLSAFQDILEADLPPGTMELAMQLVRLSGTGRTFDELLPNIAAQTKNAFIRANPQMQLGIIEMVDRNALSLVSRRTELDEDFAKVWASGFTEEEMEELIEFYSSETGKKFAELHPQLLTVEMATAQTWGRALLAELTQKVQTELRATMAAEQQSLQGSSAAPAPSLPAAPAAPQPDLQAAPAEPDLSGALAPAQ